HWPRVRQNPARGRRRPDENHPAAFSAWRASLADPARALYLPRAQTRLPALCDRRHLPLSEQDQAAAATEEKEYLVVLSRPRVRARPPRTDPRRTPHPPSAARPDTLQTGASRCARPP